MPWSQKGVGDGCEGDRPVSRTIADGCQGLASAADYGAHAPGAGTLARRLAAGPRGGPHRLRRRHWKGIPIPSAGGPPHSAMGGPAALMFEQSGGSPFRLRLTKELASGTFSQTRACVLQTARLVCKRVCQS